MDQEEEDLNHHHQHQHGHRHISQAHQHHPQHTTVHHATVVMNELQVSRKVCALCDLFSLLTPSCLVLHRCPPMKSITINCITTCTAIATTRTHKTMTQKNQIVCCDPLRRLPWPTHFRCVVCCVKVLKRLPLTHLCKLDDLALFAIKVH